MFTVKFVKYDTPSPGAPPPSTRIVAFHRAESVYLDVENDGRQVVTLGAERYTVGQNRSDTLYDVAYVMNADGRTIETVR